MWVLRNVNTAELFSDWVCNGEPSFNSEDPYVFYRECDALFVLQFNEELYNVCKVERLVI